MAGVATNILSALTKPREIGAAIEETRPFRPNRALMQDRCATGRASEERGFSDVAALRRCLVLENDVAERGQ